MLEVFSFNILKKFSDLGSFVSHLDAVKRFIYMYESYCAKSRNIIQKPAIRHRSTLTTDELDN
jgi:hypothetical protein